MIVIDIHKSLSFQNEASAMYVNTVIEKGSFTAVYGSSGAGKTSLLKMLAGLMKPDKGNIIANDAVWFNSEKKIDLQTKERGLGFVLQNHMLFPNMTIQRHLDYAKGEKKQGSLIDELVELAELDDLRHQKPDKLSGGQQQRLALIQTLIRQPAILFLDEALSAQDKEMRIKLQNYLSDIHNKWRMTILMVTHDIPEMLKLSDRALVMNQGEIVKDVPPIELFGSKKLEANYNLRSELVSITQGGIGFKLKVLVGENLIDLEIRKEDLNGLSPGDKIEMTSETFNPSIRR